MENNNKCILYYKNNSIETNFILNSELIKKLFSKENLQKILTQKNIEKLSNFLPENLKHFLNSSNSLYELLNSKTKFKTPIQNFIDLYEHNFFTETYQNNINYFNENNLEDYIEKYQNILEKIKKIYKNYNVLLNNLNPENNNILNDNLISFDLHSDLASSGYSSIDTNKDNLSNNSEINDLNNKYKYSNNDINQSLNNYPQTTKKQKNNNNINNDYLLSKSIDDNDSFLDNNNISNTDRFKNLKKNKIQITIKPHSKEEIEYFRKQEIERYKNPHLPWEYKLLNGNRAIVAPVFKKSKTIISKARDHKLFKEDKPPYITILSVVRDAASKLEDGVGTRADICELLKDSQFVNENISDADLNTIVSGALDRLHYEKDPCVKYNQHQKLWIYLHKNRTVDFQGWKDDLINSELIKDYDIKFNDDNNAIVKFNGKKIIIKKKAIVDELNKLDENYYDNEQTFLNKKRENDNNNNNIEDDDNNKEVENIIINNDNYDINNI